MSHKKSCNSSFLEGVLIGGIIGGVIGILYAPRSGRASRDIIRDAFNDCQTNRQDARSTVSADNLESLLKKTKDAIETGIASLKTQVDALKKQKDQ